MNKRRMADKLFMLAPRHDVDVLAKRYRLTSRAVARYITDGNRRHLKRTEEIRDAIKKYPQARSDQYPPWISRIDKKLRQIFFGVDAAPFHMRHGFFGKEFYYVCRDCKYAIVVGYELRDIKKHVSQGTVFYCKTRYCPGRTYLR